MEYKISGLLVEQTYSGVPVYFTRVDIWDFDEDAPIDLAEKIRQVEGVICNFLRVDMNAIQYTIQYSSEIEKAIEQHHKVSAVLSKYWFYGLGVVIDAT